MITRAFPPKKPMNHETDEVRSNQSMLTKKLLKIKTKY